MKRIVVAAALLFTAGLVFAQDQEVGSPDPEQIGVESAQQKLKEISVDKFENEGFWISKMSPDEGFTTTRLFEGGPLEKEAIPDEEGLDIPDRFVLGTRIDFLRRGYNSFTIQPVRPIPIEGITKTVSVWVAGRNYNHVLKLLIEDFFGRQYELYIDKLNFQGWKKLTIAIPPQAPDGTNGVVQRDYHYNNYMGLKILGFKVECDPLEAFGSYYIYFDDLRAVTDLFAEDNRDEDDMVDFW